MDVRENQEGEWTVLTVEGRVDGNTAPEMEAAIRQRIDRGITRMRLDLSGTAYLSSAGLRVLLGSLKTLRTASGDLQLRAPRENVREVLDISGFSSLFTILGAS